MQVTTCTIRQKIDYRLPDVSIRFQAGLCIAGDTIELIPEERRFGVERPTAPCWTKLPMTGPRRGAAPVARGAIP
jgi:hypothetical protein